MQRRTLAASTVPLSLSLLLPTLEQTAPRRTDDERGNVHRRSEDGGAAQKAVEHAGGEDAVLPVVVVGLPGAQSRDSPFKRQRRRTSIAARAALWSPSPLAAQQHEQRSKTQHNQGTILQLELGMDVIWVMEAQD